MRINTQVIKEQQEQADKEAQAKRFKAAREQAGLSVKQAAKVSGIHQYMIEHFERCGVNAILGLFDGEAATTLARVYGVTVGYLLRGELRKIELPVSKLTPQEQADLEVLLGSLHQEEG